MIIDVHLYMNIFILQKKEGSEERERGRRKRDKREKERRNKVKESVGEKKGEDRKRIREKETGNGKRRGRTSGTLLNIQTNKQRVIFKLIVTLHVSTIPSNSEI